MIYYIRVFYLRTIGYEPAQNTLKHILEEHVAEQKGADMSAVNARTISKMKDHIEALNGQLAGASYELS